MGAQQNSPPASRPGKARAWRNVDVDKLLSRLSNFSQVLMLLLVAAGYWFTVRPAFQLQLLEEDAARLTVENADARKKLEQTLSSERAAAARLQSVQNALEFERERASAMQSELDASRRRTEVLIGEMNNKEQLAQGRLKAAALTLDAANSSLKRARWNMFFDDWYLTHSIKGFNRAVGWGEGDIYDGSFIDGIAKEWPTPFDDLKGDMSVLKDRATQFRKYDLEMVKEIEAEVLKSAAEFSCKDVDFQRRREDYLREVTALSASIHQETELEIQNVIDEYKRKNQRVQITDEYRKSVERNVRFGKVWKLNEQYNNALRAEASACEDLAKSFIKRLEQGRR